MIRVGQVKKVLEVTWNDLKSQMKTMVPFAEVRPSEASAIFHYSQNGAAVCVDIKPICFRLKEKPQANKAELFVTVAGTMNFEASNSDSLRVVRFATSAGYFKELSEGRLKHVYGVHYDYDDTTVAHPVFHSQMASMADFKERINKTYNQDFGMVEDCVKPLLSNVRIPTAQMDVFAVFIQLFSDHLVNESSGENELDAYWKSVELCRIFEGSCSAPSLKQAIDRRSFHSQHWYNRPFAGT